MLHDVSTDKRYVRKYDGKTRMLHVYARGKSLPACSSTKSENAMDWDEVFPPPTITERLRRAVDKLVPRSKGYEILRAYMSSDRPAVVIVLAPEPAMRMALPAYVGEIALLDVDELGVERAAKSFVGRFGRFMQELGEHKNGKSV